MGVFKASFYPLLKLILKLITKIYVYCENLEVQSAVLRWVAEGPGPVPPTVCAQLQGLPSKLPHPPAAPSSELAGCLGCLAGLRQWPRPGCSAPQNPTWNLHAYRSGLCGLVVRLDLWQRSSQPEVELVLGARRFCSIHVGSHILLRGGRHGSHCSVLCSVIQLCLTLCDPMDCSPPDSSVHGIFQARILEQVAISSSRGSSWIRDWSRVSWISCIDRRILHHCTTWEAQVTLWRQIGQNVLWVGVEGKGKLMVLHCLLVIVPSVSGRSLPWE